MPGAMVPLRKGIREYSDNRNSKAGTDNASVKGGLITISGE